MLEEYDNFGNRLDTITPDSGISSLGFNNFSPPQGLITDTVNEPTNPKSVIGGQMDSKVIANNTVVSQSAGSSIIQQRTSGEVFSANDALYIKKSDGKVYKANASASDEKIFNFIGFAKNNSPTINQLIDVYESGYVPGFSSLIIGSWYFVTNNAGLISTTPGTYFKRVGLAMSATELYIIRDNLRTAQASGTFAITNLGANPGTTTITTGFRSSLILVRLGQRNNAATAPVWFDTTTTVVFSRITFFASWFSGLHRGFSFDLGGSATQLDEITTALFTDTSAGKGSPSLKIANLTDTGFDITLSNDGTNVDTGSRWEVLAIA